jgi:transposase InsO family protein
MGWRFSPILFDAVMRGLCRPVIDKYESRGVRVAVLKDDVMVAGTDKETTEKAFSELKEVLRSRFFKVRNEKCRDVGTDDIVFGGYLFRSGGGILPAPAKPRITEAALAVLHEDVMKQLVNREGLKRLIRSWAGTFNYIGRWLGPSQREAVHRLNDVVHFLNSDQCLEVLDTEQLVRDIDCVGRFYLGGLPALYTSGDAIGTVVVSDANQESWSAVCLSVVKLRDDCSWTDPLPFGFQTVKTKVGEALGLGDNFTLVPNRFDGGKFSETERRLRSSTWRERAAVLRAVGKFKEHISGPTVVVSDNENVSKCWRDFEATLTAGLMADWMTFCEYVSAVVHVKRTNPAMTAVDALARALNKDADIVVEVMPVRTRPPIDDVADSALYPKRLRRDQITGKWTRPEPPRELREDTDDQSDGETESLVPPAVTFVEPAVFDVRKMRYEESDIKFLIDAGRLQKVEEQGSVWYVDVTGGVLIPAACRLPLLRKLHKLGHAGVKWLHDSALRHGFYMPDLRILCKQVVTECSSCAQAKPVYGSPPRGHLPASHSPFKHICMDMVTVGGCDILVVVDMCTRYTEAYPLRNKSAEEVVRAVREWSFRYALPDTILMDNDRAFASALFTKWLQEHSVVPRFTPVYSPASNGLAERTIRTLTESIRALFLELGEEMVDVYAVLPVALYRINAAIRKDEVLSPRDQVFRDQERCPVASSFLKRERSFKGKFKVGDRVWTRILGPFDFLDKLDARFGPNSAGTVLGQLFDHTYRVQLDNGEVTSLREDRLRAEPLKAIPEPIVNPVSAEVQSPTHTEGGEL